MGPTCLKCTRLRSTSSVEVSPKRFARRRTRETVAFLHRERTEEARSPLSPGGCMQLRLICCALGLTLFTGCAELNKLASLVQAPRFEQAPDRQAEIRVMGPGAGLPVGGAGVRLWTKVTNPNAFSLTLGTLKGTLFLQE